LVRNVPPHPQRCVTRIVPPRDGFNTSTIFRNLVRHLYNSACSWAKARTTFRPHIARRGWLHGISMPRHRLERAHRKAPPSPADEFLIRGIDFDLEGFSRYQPRQRDRPLAGE